MQTKTYIIIDEKEILDLICKENNLERSGATIEFRQFSQTQKSYSCSIHVIAHPKKTEFRSAGPDQLKTIDFNTQR